LVRFYSKLLSSRQKTLNEHVAKTRNYENEKKIKHERLRFLNDKSESLREQLTQDKQSLERASFSIQSLEQEKESASKMLQENELSINTLRSEFEEQKVKTQSLDTEHTNLEKIYRAHKSHGYGSV